MNEALRQIEEALKHIIKSDDECNEAGYPCSYNKEMRTEIDQALASFRSILEGDAGEDEKIVQHWLNEGVEDSNQLLDAHDALERIVAKAKIGEAEIVKAKREVLEKLRARFIVDEEYLEVDDSEFVVVLIDEELAALKEAGK